MIDPDPLDAVQLGALTDSAHRAMHGQSPAEQRRLLTEYMRRAYSLGRDGREEAAVSQRGGLPGGVQKDEGPGVDSEAL